MMKELSPFKKKTVRLKKSLLYTIENFRKCNDCLGMNSLLNSIYDLEDLLEYEQYSGELKIKIDEILLVFEIIHDCIKNKDIIGMTDVLEFKFYPLIEELIEG